MRPQDYVHLYELEHNFWWFAGMREITAALLEPICANYGRDLSVLDAGCGTGANLNWLRRYARNGMIVGIDSSDHALKFSQRRGEPNLVKGSVTVLPFADSSFDLVTSFDVLIYPPGAKGDDFALREMHRVLRPGGVCFVRTAAYEGLYSDHDKSTNALRRYSLKALAKKIELANFQIIRATYANSCLLPLAMIRRLLGKWIGIERGSDVKPFSKRLEWLNEPLRQILASEARFLKRPGSKLPLGLSAICIGRKLIH